MKKNIIHFSGDMNLDPDSDDEKIQFGKIQEQEHHTFRHIENSGRDKKIIKKNIEQDVADKVKKLPEGHYNGQISFQGKYIKYSAYKFKDGTINIGRITVG